MSAALKYYITFLICQFISRSASIEKLAGHPGDFVFLVSGGQHTPKIQNYSRFMVSLRTRMATYYFGDNHYCAGIIISRLWILTSAQCVAFASKLPRRPRSMIVVVGTQNRLEISPTTRLLAVERVFPNPNFVLHTTNDIALLRLKSKIQLNERTQIMPLPKTPPPYGSRCFTLGWGRLYHKGPYAAMVSHVELLLFAEEHCKRIHPHYSKGDLCAGDNANFDHDPCRGDSGGPLICNGKLVAVVSWTIGCAQNLYPSLYTDIYYNLPWIDLVMSGAQGSWVVAEGITLILSNFFILNCF